LLMLGVALLAAAAGTTTARRFLPRLGAWNAVLAGGAVFLAVVAGAAVGLPGVDEVPEDFPGSLLWQFRIASLGTQFVLWTALGLLFGTLTERSLRPAPVPAAAPDQAKVP